MEGRGRRREETDDGRVKAEECTKQSGNSPILGYYDNHNLCLHS